MNKQKVLESEQVFKGRAVCLRIDTVLLPSGRKTTREIVEHSDCVAVIPVKDDGKLIMVKQHRHATGKELLEIPAGGIEKGEDPVSCVRRELQEEIGFYPEEIKSLGGFYSAPGFCTEYLYLFLAKGLKPSRLVAEDTEEIQVVEVELSEVPHLISSGKICDAKTIAGLLRYIFIGDK